MNDRSTSIYQTSAINSQLNSCQMPARDVSPIECAARELGQRIELLNDQIFRLRSRVHLVSSPQEPSLPGDSVASVQHAVHQLPKSPLEDQLRSLIAGVDSAAANLTNIMDYLQT